MFVEVGMTNTAIERKVITSDRVCSASRLEWCADLPSEKTQKDLEISAIFFLE
jgi:hypothetical protein